MLAYFIVTDGFIYTWHLGNDWINDIMDQCIAS